ncbi:hypothetical protein BC936DRAFT_137072 [Jimgerdemannia flammicorona]|uniref:Protein kinase domain-containing protein n=1 Tax=Jimgerdemannia flammicorona TaxID=994334 RepID=A0A433CY38_9FUNG|nr:hypothetical protein BC936DRAFT_137072 [Jimgerdemannia flammicorona]
MEGNKINGVAPLQFIPFNQLTVGVKDHLIGYRSMFPGHDEELYQCLTDLKIPEMVDYLRWIPYERFKDVEVVGKGGFAIVYRAKVEFANRPPQLFALKEMKLAMLREVRISSEFARITVFREACPGNLKLVNI